MKLHIYKRLPIMLWLTALVTLSLAQAPNRAAQVAGVPRRACFPLETLPAELRAKSEALLLKALDSEALYTIVSGLKPMSSGFASFKFNVAKPDLIEIAQTRALLAAWRCGDDLHADVHHFEKIYDDDKTKEKIRFAEAFIFHRPALAEMIKQRADFFAPYGLTPNAHPIETLLAIEYADEGPRWRGYGYLFGFPQYAVDFFVAAGEEQSRTGKFVTRDFYSIPTLVANQRQFVWAVPKGHAESDDDRALKARAAPILAEYQKRRARYIGAGKRGVVELLRDWFDDGKGRCSARNTKL